ncbi:MAG: BON domain-containing protein [Chloroflexi bacterium]|nr:BON domain-containing protein [Chloroflexota bacterium]
MSNERFVLRPGALVVGADDSLGWIEALLATPGSGQISGFVLSDGPLFDRGVTVPIETVVRTEDSRVHVWLTAAQVNHLADLHSRDSVRSPIPQERRIQAGQRVTCRDGEVGQLVLVFVDPQSDQVTHLVVRRGGLPGREVIVPIAWVREITDDPIVLEAGSPALDQQPAYRPDDEITDAVSSLLWYRSDVHLADLRYVRARTRNGVVELGGKTRTEQSRLAIDGLVRGVRGVLGVRNELRTFEALSAAAQALRQSEIQPAVLVSPDLPAAAERRREEIPRRPAQDLPQEAVTKTALSANVTRPLGVVA